MGITAKQVSELRKTTGAGMMDCKKALVENDGDMEKAIDFLKKKGLAAAAKRTDRVAAEGFIGSYIHHNGRIAVLVELNCETDFVAKTEGFSKLANDVAMHIAASNPTYLSPDDIPADLVENERRVFVAQVIESGKPENIADRIVEGKLNKWKNEQCLLTQEFLNDDKFTVGNYIINEASSMKENVRVRRFVRYELGEGIEKADATNLADEVAKMTQG